MRYWVLAGILLLAFLVQSVLGHFLAINQIAPNVVLVVVIAYGLLFGPEVGLIAGLLGGLLLDLTFSHYVGLRLLALGSVGLAIGMVEERVFKDNLLLGSIGGLAGSVTGQSIVLIILWIFGRMITLDEVRTLGLAALYDMVLCTIIYRALYRNYRYLRPDPRGTIVLRRQ
ncbi:MAG: rod shape-determining protein MreD [Bacillota bacterium]